MLTSRFSAPPKISLGGKGCKIRGAGRDTSSYTVHFPDLSGRGIKHVFFPLYSGMAEMKLPAGQKVAGPGRKLLRFTKEAAGQEAGRRFNLQPGRFLPEAASRQDLHPWSPGLNSV